MRNVFFYFAKSCDRPYSSSVESEWCGCDSTCSCHIPVVGRSVLAPVVGTSKKPVLL